MTRTLDALRVCAAKFGRASAPFKLVATEACRIASNGGEFLDRVKDKLGLDIEILTARSRRGWPSRVLPHSSTPAATSSWCSTSAAAPRN